jgi:hypothetical protein
VYVHDVWLPGAEQAAELEQARPEQACPAARVRGEASNSQGACLSASSEDVEGGLLWDDDADSEAASAELGCEVDRHGLHAANGSRLQDEQDASGAGVCIMRDARRHLRTSLTRSRWTGLAMIGS